MQNINKPEFKDIHDSTINYNVTQIISVSPDYNNLLDQLKTQQKLFDRTPEDEQQERLEISAKINNLENRIKQFKEDVLRLAEQFNRIEINTDRLRRAKEHFDKGEIGEARAVLESELEQMTDENKRLIQEKERFEHDTLPKLINNSNEFFILALSTQTNYANPNWLADTCNYFELSIKAVPNKDNVFGYAYFLDNHNKFSQAESYYQRYLNDFADDISIAERAMTLNNLAILHKAQNEYEEALKEYEEALKIRRELAEVNPSTYLPYVATTLNNLANLHKAQNEYEEALKEYEEALKIYRELAETNFQAYFPSFSMTLINLSIFYLQAVPQREKSIEYAVKAIIILLPYVESVPFTQKYFENAMAVLKAWNLSVEEIYKLIEEAKSDEI